MKESVLEVLVYLFENYLHNEEQPAPDQDALHSELEEMGFSGREINKALRWLDELSEFRRDSETPPRQHRHSLRHYTREEAKRIGPDCQGFLLYLERSGVLDHEARELVIDRVMALESEDISLDQIKWVVLLALFNQPGQEAAFAWMHDLVYEIPSVYLH